MPDLSVALSGGCSFCAIRFFLVRGCGLRVDSGQSTAQDGVAPSGDDAAKEIHNVQSIKDTVLICNSFDYLKVD